MTPGLSDRGSFLAPWPHVSAISDTHAVYYAASPPRSCVPCLPPSSSLSRHVLRRPGLLAAHPHAPDNAPLLGKPVLVIVNPKSGTASASLVKSNLATLSAILTEAGLRTVVQHTKRRAHAPQLIAEHAPDQLAQFAAVVAVGGDGTLHEVVNGLCNASRPSGADEPDWKHVPPVAVLPAGSGNAIAASTGLSSAHHAALNVVHSLRTGAAKSLALMRYRPLAADRPELLSVGGVQWGFTANVDLGTDHLRFMGNTRFDVGALIHIAKKSSAQATFKVNVDLTRHETVAADIERERRRHKGTESKPVNYGRKVTEDTYLLEGDFVMCVAWNSAFISEGFMVTPKARVTETGVFDLIVVRSDISRAEMLKVLTSCKDGSFLWKTDSFVYYKATRVEFQKLEGEFLTVDGESVPVEPFVLEIAPQDGKIRILNSFSEPVLSAQPRPSQ